MKFFGKIGYGDTVETAPGVATEVIVEREYYGDVIKDTRRLESVSTLNDNINIGNQFSILADAYAYEHFYKILYVVWMGVKWKVTNVDASTRPRLIFTIGGEYNE